MTDEKEGIWNGGNTYTKRELEILRKQEDQYDTMFSERVTREELVKREKMMKQDKNYEKIQQNHKVSRKPMHELYKGINKQINNFEKWKNDKTPWLKMAGPNRDKR